jgi:hypothetical protein
VFVRILTTPRVAISPKKERIPHLKQVVAKVQKKAKVKVTIPEFLISQVTMFSKCDDQVPSQGTKLPR